MARWYLQQRIFRPQHRTGELLTDIEDALKRQDLSDAVRKKLTDLQSTIDDDDNNYIMIAKLKK